MNAVLYPVCACIAWISLAFKLAGRGRGPAAVAVALFYLFMGLTFTISDPRVWGLLGEVSGVPNLALLLSQGSVMGVAASQLAALTYWELPAEVARPKVRNQVYAFSAVFVAMAALFVLADLETEDTTTAVIRYAGNWRYALYLLLYVTAFAIAQCFLVARCLRYARAVEGRWLGRGLRLAAVGAVGGLAYVLARYADIAAAPLGLDPAAWEPVARLGAGLGAILALVGWSLPGWGPQVSALRDWVRDVRAYRALHPLWAALCRANPDLALDPGAGRTALRDVDFRLHRRVVEIRDGRRWLRAPAAPPDLTADERAAAEAAAIAAALRGGDRLAPPPHAEPHTPSDDETRWLARVSRAYAALER
ncbi:MAB_1171c family putative transporter [Actinokineospora guangxiensis]|uniref:MAB_1171c family putative transporter n=1 Tax=Actinokineospora guangxiensis TaxID=1490288 RepID=A0ABW0EUC1_9PSEU